jgi:hypothetical protein
MGRTHDQLWRTAASHDVSDAFRDQGREATSGVVVMSAPVVVE